MKITMYGAAICPDCVAAKAILEKRSDIMFDYKNITESTKTLKEFLSYRDHEEMFKGKIREGKIGIPFFILEDGTKTFEVFDFVDGERLNQLEDSCSIDGSGQC